MESVCTQGVQATMAVFIPPTAVREALLTPAFAEATALVKIVIIAVIVRQVNAAGQENASRVIVIPLI